jgi:oligopeptide/dipeptide ABC transporter ATP-binding protein
MDAKSKLKRVTLQGEVPSPIDAPKGCTFSTRCPYAMDICREVKPILRISKSANPVHEVACHLETPPSK